MHSVALTRLLPNPADSRLAFAQSKFVVVADALPPSDVQRWQRKALRLARYARAVSRHDQEFELLYRVVTGNEIRAHWPELFAFYTGSPLRNWIQAVTEEEAIYTSTHLASAINLNILQGQGSVYRWHFDAVPYTALLYLTDVRPEDGGALEVIAGCQPHTAPLTHADAATIWPKAGTLVLMDGTRCYHHASPLLRSTLRLSIPMVFPSHRNSQRPAGLDSYLYEQT